MKVLVSRQATTSTSSDETGTIHNRPQPIATRRDLNRPLQTVTVGQRQDRKKAAIRPQKTATDNGQTATRP